MEDITLAAGRCNGKRWRAYYYFGNFYYPLDGLDRETKRRIKNLVTVFKRNHKAMIEKDRANPEYKTLLQLFDEQQLTIDK